MSTADEVADVLRRVSEVALVEARSADEFEPELFSAITTAEENLADAKSYLRDLEEPWLDFIDAHPELTERPSEEARLEFTDEELFTALVEAMRRWDEELQSFNRPRVSHDRGVRSHVVAKVLAGEERVTSGDVVRVGQRLGKLTRAGRTTRIVEPYAPLRYLVSADDA